MKVCSIHGEKLRFFRFCDECGRRLLDKDDKRCTCGEIVSPNQRFCTACGKPQFIPESGIRNLPSPWWKRLWKRVTDVLPS